LVALVLVAVHVSHSREPEKPESDSRSAQNLIDMAWHALDEEITEKNVDKAIKYLKMTLELDRDNHEVMVELADEYFFRGRLMPEDSEENIKKAKEFYAKGKKYAADALDIKDSAGAHYWYAANLGAMHKHNSIMRQASVFPDVAGHVKWVEKNDPHYKYGVTARFWAGVVIASQPLVIDMMGRDPQQIFQDLEGEIKRAPGYVENYVMMAKYLRHLEKPGEAVATLEDALAIDPTELSGEEAMNRYSQERARMFYREWTGKEYAKNEMD